MNRITQEIHERMPKAKPYKDLSGVESGRLLVIGDPRRHPKGVSTSRTVWKCKCECGETTFVSGDMIASGRVRSCGCLQREAITKHGLRRAECRTYDSWYSMKARCDKKGCNGYENYGGSGITYSERWMDFECFVDDMGLRPEGKTLDRIDSCGNYSVENCRWATVKEQNQNRRTTVWIEVDGRRDILANWARSYGISPVTISRRIARGWSASDAVKTPPRKRRVLS